jgi:hypothetical protein
MSGLIDPAAGASAITPSDTENLAEPCRGIWVGVQGNLKVTMIDGDVVTFPAMAAGVVHPIQIRRVWATDTTATGIVGVY